MKASRQHSNNVGSVVDESKSRPTILVFNSHPELCHVADLLLRRCGYHVLCATNGEEVKRLAGEGHVDLLLADIEVGLQELGVSTWFQSASPETKIAFMSDHPRHDVPVEFSSYIEKPFIRLDLLLRRIREVLGLTPEMSYTSMAV